MSYIAFIDMIGTRASALISNGEYTDAINDFTGSLKQVGDICNCKVYGYSDNAYVEVDTLDNMVKFFRMLRKTLMYKHRYFVGAVDCGSLNAGRITLANKSFLMKFTEPATIDIYMSQCQFYGIGISLSKKVVEELKATGRESEFCQSVFQKNLPVDENYEYHSVFDISYDNVILEQLKYIIADYLMTAANNERAGRYYITTIISMIKCLDEDVVVNELDALIGLLSLKDIPPAFKTLKHMDEYFRLFTFAIIDFVLSLRERDKAIDSVKICRQIIVGCSDNYALLVEKLPCIPTAVISNKNKHEFLNIIYGMKQE